jgi:hypothetical protein
MQELIDSSAAQHAKHLLDLVASFPTTNPTPTPDEGITSTISANGYDDAGATADADLPQLISSIRARYRLLCTSLGVRPRLVAAASADFDADEIAAAGEVSGVEVGRERGRGAGASSGAGGEVDGPVVLGGVVQGIEGPMKGVDTRQLRF